jgi:hypothetical protein
MERRTFMNLTASAAAAFEPMARADTLTAQLEAESKIVCLYFLVVENFAE